MAFPNEVQHFPLDALAPGNRAVALREAERIRNLFIHRQEQLQSYDMPVVRFYSLDTDSETSDDEQETRQGRTQHDGSDLKAALG
jgi:hypothetical protein